MVTEASLLPVEVNILIKRGTDNTLAFQLTDSAGFPVDITGDDVSFTARAGFAGEEKIVTKTNSSHAGPTSGRTEFTVSRTEIDDEVPAQNGAVWKYEVRREIGGSGGDNIVYFEGDLEIKPAVTM